MKIFFFFELEVITIFYTIIHYGTDELRRMLWAHIYIIMSMTIVAIQQANTIQSLKERKERNSVN
jgi:hypothetical protein